jgi:hypothetical protein
MLEEPFYAVASAMLVLMIRPRDCDAVMSWMTFHISCDVEHVET